MYTPNRLLWGQSEWRPDLNPNKRQSTMARLIPLLHKHIGGKPFFFRRRNVSYATHRLRYEQSHFDQAMDSVHYMSSNPFSYLLGLCNNICALKKVHALLLVHGLSCDLSCSTKLVSMYGSLGHVELARLVFDGIPDADFYSWKVMLRWYFLNDLYWEIIGFYSQMRLCVRDSDNVVFSIVLKACSELRNVYEGRKLHCQIFKAGSPDSFVTTGLVDMYAKCGELESSRSLFDENPDRNVVSWTSMIAGYVQNGCAEEGLVLFNRMRDSFVETNQYTLGSLVTGCTQLRALHQGKWLHGYVIKCGFELNSYLVTALLDMHVKCGAITDARSVFDELSSNDLVSWTAMIVGYTQNGCPYEALKLFTDKKWVGILPNNVTITSILSACGQLGNLRWGRLVHACAIKLGLVLPNVTNALIDMYAKFHKNELARYLLERLADKDVVTWNSIISGFSQNGSAYEALEMFHRMSQENVLPDAVTLVSAFAALASLGALKVGSSMHAYFMKKGLLAYNVFTGTALLTFYGKCGDAKSARKVFDSMEEKSTITWSAMIGGYGIQGDGHGSLALFEDMLKEELQPNEATFTTILSACSHTGMVREGWKLFSSMCQDYNFVPSMKHYSCMVDLLARAGRLEEALDFIRNMPLRPDVNLFGAFLHGCGLYSRFDLGEIAIKRMLELHPDEASYYVLMCNLYASDGRWNQVKQVRELMAKRGLNKSPGCSLTEMEISYDSSYRVASVG